MDRNECGSLPRARRVCLGQGSGAKQTFQRDAFHLQTLPVRPSLPCDPRLCATRDSVRHVTAARVFRATRDPRPKQRLNGTFQRDALHPSPFSASKSRAVRQWMHYAPYSNPCRGSTAVHRQNKNRSGTNPPTPPQTQTFPDSLTADLSIAFPPHSPLGSKPRVCRQRKKTEVCFAR